MRQIGSVQSIWRYPVKGMAGESIAQCSIDAKGIQGDRCYAVRDRLRNEIQSCKFRPPLLRCIARYTNQPRSAEQAVLSILFPDGSERGADAPDLDSKLSALLGHESTLEALHETQGLDAFRRYKTDKQHLLDELTATFARESGEAGPDFSQPTDEFLSFVTVPGSYFLVSPLHIISSASLAYGKRLLPTADWDCRRFRPNLVIETLSEYSGLVEQQWLGKHLHIGTAQIFCNSSAIRCGAVTREQQGLPFDKGILRSIVKDTDQNLGIYGDITGSAQLHVGDPVFLVD